MNIIGHQKIISFFDRCLEAGSMNHAYLFSGPDQVGKFTLARELALKLVGSDAQKNGELIIVSPEIVEQKGVTKSRGIRIEDIRDLQAHFSRTSFYGGRKAAIIDQADRMTVSAQNALLKILEEPPENSFIFLVASDHTKLLPTVISRTQHKKFNPVSNEEIGQMAPSGPDRNEIIFWSMGRPGLAIRLMEDKEGLARKKESLGELKDILSGQGTSIFSLAENLAKDENEVVEKLTIWTFILRQSIIGGTERLGADRVKAIAFLGGIEKSLDKIKETNANVRLVLENLFLSV